jgi:hypothetical protein
MNTELIFKRAFYFLAGIQTMMFLYYTLAILAPGKADECHFILAIDRVNENGWSEAVQFGLSIPYFLITYPLSFFMPTYLALRLVNLFLLILFFRYLWISGYKNGMVYALLLAYISTVSFYLFGTNDTLFIIGLSIFFIETYTHVSTGKMNFPILAFTGLIVSCFTRQMIVFYLPLIAFSMYLIGKPYWSMRVMRIPIATAVLLLLLSFPSLVHNHTLSYDNKKAPEGLAWAQIGYLTTIESNQHLRAEGNHPSWDEVRAYLKLHGENSLPRSYGESIFFDFKLTLLEFPEDFIVGLKGSIRQIGILLFLPLVVYFFSDKSYRMPSLYLLAAYMGTLAIFSFVILAIVELRWLGSVAILTLVGSYKLLQETELKFGSRKLAPSNLTLLVYLSYIILSAFGVYTYSKLVL